MTALCLTGWQQPHDALRDVAPLDAVHFDYSAHGDLPSCYRALAEFAEVDALVGWSLGGMIAMVAVAHGIVKPKRLVLIAAQYQYLSDDHFPYAMSLAMAEETKQFYFTDPEAMLQQFQLLMVKGDTHEKQLARRMFSVRPKPWKNGFFWLEQLAMIRACDMDMAGFPPTAIVHGERDIIAPPEHAQYLHKAIVGSELHLLEGCAHAPHLHDARKLREIVETKS